MPLKLSFEDALTVRAVLRRQGRTYGTFPEQVRARIPWDSSFASSRSAHCFFYPWYGLFVEFNGMFAYRPKTHVCLLPLIP